VDDEVAAVSYKVFISSTMADHHLARQIAGKLEEAGVKVLSSERRLARGKIASNIARFLRESDEVVVVLTDNSLDNPWTMYEMGAALSLQKKITPVVVGVNRNKLPPMVKEHIRLSDLGTYISKLRKRSLV